MNSIVSRALKDLTSSPGEFTRPAVPAANETSRSGLTRAIATLPTRERLVLALYYEEALSTDEVAAVLGISTEETELLHTRALSHLASRAAVQE
jgi:RNA polymerase sigma factor for flagellar operon FliA